MAFIQQTATEFADMVDDLLDLAKVEAGRIEISPAWFEMVDLFSALRGMFKPMLAGAQVHLVFEEPEAGMPRLYTDDRKLSQVLRNFISNALKFTERGGVRLAMRPAPGADGDGGVDRGGEWQPAGGARAWVPERQGRHLGRCDVLAGAGCQWRGQGGRRRGGGRRQRARQKNVELPLVISDHADWDELTATALELRPGELWITHGREEALARWAELNGIPARALALACRRRMADRLLRCASGALAASAAAGSWAAQLLNNP
mgnify:CR=1 FL=1